MSTYRGIGQTAADTVELKRALKDLRNRADAAGLGNRNLGQTVRVGNAPPILTGLAGFAQMRRIFLTWNDSQAADLARYEVQVSTSQVFAGASSFFTGNAHFTFENATTGTTYYARVRAINVSGNASPYSNVISVTPSALGSGDIGGGSDISPVSLLNTQTVDSGTAATIDWTGSSIFSSSLYTHYQIVFTCLAPDTSATAQFGMQFYMNGAWATGATDYTWLNFGVDDNTLTFTGFASNATHIYLNHSTSGTNWSSTTRRTGAGWIRIYPNYQANAPVHARWCLGFQDHTSNDINMLHGNGAYKGGDSDTFDGIRLKFNANNIAVGRFSLYGFRKLSG